MMRKLMSHGTRLVKFQNMNQFRLYGKQASFYEDILNIPHIHNIIRAARRTQWRNTIIISSSVLVGTGLTSWYFYDNIKTFFGKQGADVATMSLNDEAVHESVHELTGGVLKKILADQNTSNTIVAFLQSLVARPDTQQLLVGLLITSLNDPKLQEQLQQLILTQATDLLNNEGTLNSVTDLVYKLIDKPETKQVLYNLLARLIKDEQFKSDLNNLTGDIIESDVVQKKATAAGLQSVHDILDDPKVQQHSIDFFKGTFSNDKLKENASQSAYDVLWGAFTPSFLRSNKSDSEENV
jgi:hypothetical protein